MASAVDSRLAYARLSASRYGKPPPDSYTAGSTNSYTTSLGHDPWGPHAETEQAE